MRWRESVLVRDCSDGKKTYLENYSRRSSDLCWENILAWKFGVESRWAKYGVSTGGYSGEGTQS